MKKRFKYSIPEQRCDAKAACFKGWLVKRKTTLKAFLFECFERIYEFLVEFENIPPGVCIFKTLL